MSGWVVEVVEGPDAGEQRPIAGELEIGRENAGLRLHDEQASRRHARLTATADGVTIEDLSSSNGTFVNGEEVHASIALRPGDEIIIGVSVLTVRTGEQANAQPTMVQPLPPALAMGAKKPDYVPAAVAAGPVDQPELDRLLDINVKSKARLAPLGILVIICFAAMAYLVR